MKKAMKVMAMLLCVVTMATLSACSKEDNNQRKIIGSWELVRIYGTNEIGEEIDEHFGSREEVWTFKSDGTMIFDVSGESPLYSSYTIFDDNKLQIMQLIVVQFDIKELTNNKMILHSEILGLDEYWEFRKIS